MIWKKVFGAYKLIRPINAGIVFVSLFVTRVILFYLFDKNDLAFELSSFHFALVCIAGALILGSGNVVNDILDMEIDKINKPQKIIVGAIISKKSTWLLYWTLNIFALFISVYLALYYQLYTYVIIPILSILLLYIYSAYFKKSYLIGNLIVAFLCAFLPMIGFLVEFRSSIKLQSVNTDDFQILMLKAISMFFFSFLIVTMREIVKDCEDIEGDKKEGGKTFAIIQGERNAMKFVNKVFLCYILGCLLLLFLRFRISGLDWYFLIGSIYIGAIFVTYYLHNKKAHNKLFFSSLSNKLKIFLILGLAFILF